MVMVTRQPNESDQQLIKRFRSAVVDGGILDEIREKRFFQDKTEEKWQERRRKKKLHF